MNKKILRLVSLVMISVMTSGALYGCSLFDSSNKEKADLYDYYNISDDSTECAVIVDYTVSETNAIIQDETIYIDIDTVNDYINKKIYWDSNEGTVLYTNSVSTASYTVGENSYVSGDGETVSTDYTPAIEENETLYLAIDFIELFSDIEYETYDGPSRICIISEWGEYETVSVTSKTAKIRTGDGNQNEIMCEAEKGETLEYIEEGSLYSCVKTESGIIGYVSNDDISSVSDETRTSDFEEPEYTSLTRDEKISMAWHQVSGKAGNKNISTLMEDVSGVNVLSPTWFKICDSEGNISSYATFDYVQTVHNMGIEVWALIDDFEYDEDGNRYVDQVLPYTSKRQNLVQNLIKEVLYYGIDGINIDFEYVGLEIADDYLQFLRELSVECRENGIVLSIDNYVPSAWSGYYDREQQGEIADYVVVMSYDEHNTDSDVAGSVASISYVTEAVTATVLEVGDSSKVINGVPFYTRVWIETPEEYAEDGSNIIEDAANGNYALSSQAVTMEVAKSLYEAAGAEPIWNEECGQYYVSYGQDNSTYMIWLEDASSIELKMQLVEENKLGGAAYWKLGMETSDIWDVISQYIE